MAKQETTNSLAQRWQEATDEFQKNLATIARRANHEAIHDARLAMKRLRSYATLYDEATGASLRKELEKFASLYRAAGACRDAYNALRLAKKFGKKLDCVFPLLDARLTFAMQSDLRYLRYALSARPVASEEWLALKRAMPNAKLPPARLKSIQNVIEERWESVASSENLNDPESLHDLRKALKWTLYCLDATPMPERFSPKRLKDIDELAALLGKWQDLHQFERVVKRFKENLLRKSDAESALVKRLLKAIKAEKAETYALVSRKFSSLRKARAA